MRQFDYTNHARDNRPKPCTPEVLHRLLETPGLSAKVAAIRAERDHDRRAVMKQGLPVVCWNAHFAAGLRRKSQAVPSMLGMMDVDNVTDMAAVFGAMDEAARRAKLADKEALWEAMGICVVHYTPSMGLRIVGDLCSLACKNVLEWTRKAASMLGLLDVRDVCDIDMGVFDLSRCAFLVGKEDVLWLDEKLLFRDPEYLVENPDFRDSQTGTGTLTGTDGTACASSEAAAVGAAVGAAGAAAVAAAEAGAGNAGNAGNAAVSGGKAPDTVAGGGALAAEAGAGNAGNAAVSGGKAPDTVAGGGALAAGAGSGTLAAGAGGGTLAAGGGTLGAGAGGGTAGGPGASYMAFTPEELKAAQAFRYNDHTLTEIAEQWLLLTGRPIVGERHKKYFEMAGLFKNICERNPAVLFVQLPDFGKPAEERLTVCRDVIKRQPSSALPADFYHFLVDYGFKPRDLSYAEVRAQKQADAMKVRMDEEDRARKEQEEKEAEALAAEIEAIDTEIDKLPRFPSVYNIYKRIMPEAFVKGSVLTLDAALGTHFSNITARYLDGVMERPCFHNLVIGPPSCGKGKLNEIVRYIMAPLKERDLRMLALENEFKEAEKRAKNKKEQPERPDLHFRTMEKRFSCTSLLERQEMAKGLHQLINATEIDTLYKLGGHAQFDDIYRLAYHGEELSQHYFGGSWNGCIDLRLNVFATGTPDQFTKHYGDPSNGLCSRINVAMIDNAFSSCFVPKTMTGPEEAYIKKVLDFADSLTYCETEEGKLGVLPLKDISEDMAFMLPVCEDFINKQVQRAREDVDDTRDIFLKRVALDMFRGAMVDWGCALGKLDKKRRQTIIDFRWAKAEEMLETKIALYQEKISETLGLNSTKQTKSDTLFAQLPEVFTAVDVDNAKGSMHTAARKIISLWKKAGFIEKEEGTKSFRKV